MDIHNIVHNKLYIINYLKKIIFRSYFVRIKLIELMTLHFVILVHKVPHRLMIRINKCG